MIRKQGNKYVLYTSDGSRVLGTHESRTQAEAQERAIKLSKLRKGKSNGK